MTDDLRKRHPQDASRISTTEAWEIDYWTHELGIDLTALRRTVAKVGNGATAVRDYLAKRHAARAPYSFE